MLAASDTYSKSFSTLETPDSRLLAVHERGSRANEKTLIISYLPISHEISFDKVIDAMKS